MGGQREKYLSWIVRAAEGTRGIEVSLNGSPINKLSIDRSCDSSLPLPNQKRRGGPGHTQNPPLKPHTLPQGPTRENETSCWQGGVEEETKNKQQKQQTRVFPLVETTHQTCQRVMKIPLRGKGCSHESCCCRCGIASKLRTLVK